MEKESLQQQLNKFKEILQREGNLEPFGERIECLTYIPAVQRYRSWMFRYYISNNCIEDESIIVILNDEGNGYYSYLGCINEIVDTL